jgi:hypothetical protein
MPNNRRRKREPRFSIKATTFDRYERVIALVAAHLTVISWLVDLLAHKH